MMIRKFYRSLHVSSTTIRLNQNILFKKDSFSFINLSKVKPNLIIIGSQKCGTTSLHNYLNEHPDIFMSSPMKEPGYFIFEEWAKSYWSEKNIVIKNKKEMLVKHMLIGYSGQKYFGESSTYYTQNQREQLYQIPKQIKYEVQSPKLIFVIRNPLERLVSVYYHVLKYNNYQGSFEEMLASSDSYYNTSLYYTRLKGYLEVFDKKDILILRFEDLIQNPQALISSVYNFLKLEDFHHKEFKQFNTTSPKQKVKFTAESFANVIDGFKKEKKRLETEFNMNLDWDLSKDNWVE